MDPIQQRVDAAHRRLLVRQWAGRLVVWLTAALAVAAVAIALPKLFALPALPDWWGAAWLAAAAVVGTTGPTLGAFLRPKTRLEAAVEIDRRFDLRERVASCLSLSEADLGTEAGAALARDAGRAIERIEVAERFTLGLDRRAWLPVGPAVVALLLATLVANRTADASLADAEAEKIAAEEVQKAAEKARRELRKRREDAEKQGLADASDLLKKIESGTADLAKKEPKDTTRTAVKLNDLTKQLAERRKKLGGGEELRKQLNQMKDLGRGPAEKVADAMKQGDWKKALKEIEGLRKQLAGGKVSAEQQEQLANQLEKMQQRLAQAAERQEQQKQELQRQLAEAQRKGDLNQAGKLQQKLDQMGAKEAQQQQLQQMAQQMQQAQQALQQGKPQDAAKAMEQMAQQMQQLQQEAAEMEMLDGAMTDIMQAKAEMGMEAGDMPQGGQGMGQFGQGGKGGQGEGECMGEGQGSGPRPDEENAVNFRDSKVKQNVGRGASTFGGLVDGPSVKGEVVESIKTGLTSDTVQPADPLTSERLPKSRREHAEEYFRNLRESL